MSVGCPAIVIKHACIVYECINMNSIFITPVGVCLRNPER